LTQLPAFDRFLKRFGFTPAEALDANGGSDTSWPADRCGIYAWRSADGQVYLGQSIDCRKRLRSHQKNHGDIVAFGFKQVPRDDLDRVEARLAIAIERVGPVRNILLVSKTYTIVPFDEVIAAQTDRGPSLKAQAVKTARVWARMSGHPLCEDIVRATRHFIENAIPCQQVTEGIFWSVSCPQGKFVRVNCGVQEVFTCVPLQNGTLEIRLLCKRSLDFRLKQRLYRTGSFEHRWTMRKFWAFQAWDKVRPTTEYLMRHSSPLNSSSHCPQVLHTDLRRTVE
jgi:GIY-YIG catalytic domain